MSGYLLEVRNLTKVFQGGHGAPRFGVNLAQLFGTGIRDDTAADVIAPQDGTIVAVRDLDLAIRPGEIVGLVGESGSGKSTVARCLMHLIEPTDGDILYENQSILNLRGSQLKAFRQKMQMVFQDPTASLDPRFTVERTLAEPLRVHHVTGRRDRRARMRELLDAVHLRQDHLDRYPHQLSGGEKQRVVIARALATNPRFLILDEPTSALDASVQVRIISLLQELKERFQMTYLVISHDLSVIRHLCEHVIVMYLGEAIETGPTTELIDNPRHPYTQALMSAIPIPDPDYVRARIRLKGDIRNSLPPEIGCPLAYRCPHAVEACFHTPQRLVPLDDQRAVACHRVINGEI
ncbi:MAG: ABC transporter ATP-binding protein [Chloroflexi bacterium]|nr:MAG: ABC transporter ATP-binding protein [Chloroflexota bacterium]